MLLSEGQMSDYKGAALMIDTLPRAKVLLGDKGYDADWLRAALADRGIAACIPSKATRKVPIPHDATLYLQRHKIEIHVRKAQGLAAHPHPLRSMRTHLHVRYLHRRIRHLLARSMSPEPALCGLRPRGHQATPPEAGGVGSFAAKRSVDLVPFGRLLAEIG